MAAIYPGLLFICTNQHINRDTDLSEQVREENPHRVIDEWNMAALYRKLHSRRNFSCKKTKHERAN